MARTREFDIDDVLQKAMEAFWKRGYAATSMADIYKATGLKPGSLYAAFTDKEDLFRRCFEAYARHFESTLPQHRDGAAAIADWLTLQAMLAAEDPERKGCLIVNTMTERDIHSEATKAMAKGRMQDIRDFFSRNLTIAAARGEIDPGLPADVHADALMGAVVSMMALGRAGADKKVIEHVGQAALAALNVTHVT